jgi:hypothetical protein
VHWSRVLQSSSIKKSTVLPCLAGAGARFLAAGMKDDAGKRIECVAPYSNVQRWLPTADAAREVS